MHCKQLPTRGLAEARCGILSANMNKVYCCRHQSRMPVTQKVETQMISFTAGDSVTAYLLALISGGSSGYLGVCAKMISACTAPTIGCKPQQRHHRHELHREFRSDAAFTRLTQARSLVQTETLCFSESLRHSCRASERLVAWLRVKTSHTRCSAYAAGTERVACTSTRRFIVAESSASHMQRHHLRLDSRRHRLLARWRRCSRRRTGPIRPGASRRTLCGNMHR